MRFHFFKSLQRIDERVFAEASELAQRGLERCIADQQNRLGTMNETETLIVENRVALDLHVKTG